MASTFAQGRRALLLLLLAFLCAPKLPWRHEKSRKVCLLSSHFAGENNQTQQMLFWSESRMRRRITSLSSRRVLCFLFFTLLFSTSVWYGFLQGLSLLLEAFPCKTAKQSDKEQSQWHTHSFLFVFIHSGNGSRGFWSVFRSVSAMKADFQGVSVLLPLNVILFQGNEAGGQRAAANNSRVLALICLTCQMGGASCQAERCQLCQLSRATFSTFRGTESLRNSQ